MINAISTFLMHLVAFMCVLFAASACLRCADSLDALSRRILHLAGWAAVAHLVFWMVDTIPGVLS